MWVCECGSVAAGGGRGEVRDQRSEDRGRKTEDRRLRTEDGGLRTEDGGQKTENRGQRSDLRLFCLRQIRRRRMTLNLQTFDSTQDRELWEVTSGGGTGNPFNLERAVVSRINANNH